MGEWVSEEETWDREEDPILWQEAMDAAKILYEDIVTQLQSSAELEEKTDEDLQAISILEAYENNMRIVLEYLDSTPD